MSIEALNKTIQQTMPASTWSRGVSLARDKTVFLDRERGGEVKLRVRIPGRTVSPSVTLWPADEDWHCDCGDKQDPCAHVAAGVVALKNGWALAIGEPTAGAEVAASSKTAKPRLRYGFRRHDGLLLFDRWIIRGNEKEPLTQALIAYMGGVQSGRITRTAPSATQSDYTIDAIMGVPPRSLLSTDDLARLFSALREQDEEVDLDGVKVKLSHRALAPRAILIDAKEAGKDGFLLKWKTEEIGCERFRNGAVLANGILAASPPPPSFLPSGGTFVPLERASRLVEDLLPKLEEKDVRIEIATDRLPRARERVVVPPRALLKVEPGESGDCTLTAELLYGDPALARIQDGELIQESGTALLIRDLAKERELTRRLQQELHLQPGKPVKLSADEASAFVERVRGWELEGTGKELFKKQGTLAARFDLLGEDDFALEFSLPGGARADAGQALRSWRSGRSLVPLLDGGYAELPADWLSQYGERVEALLLAREGTGKLPRYAIPMLTEIAEESGAPAPASMTRIREALMKFEGIPEAKLPDDLRADLRPYQRKGIDWLSYLKSIGTGALLADDMGLGKTLQALAVLERRTLIVAPTSVLQAWVEQVARFRPGLKIQVYAGPQRELDLEADLIVTSYGILRIDQEKLSAIEWKAAVLDEAQTIKNPDSQAARAAFRLKAEFKVALTGTPIENRLEDLWSQFQFLSPGLLGTRETFQRRAAEGGAASVRARIRPFVLRRLKKDVAPELPPRTEVTLRCEFNEEERSIYRAILGGARKEVLARLKEGGSVLAALELLLRLRQACAHPCLVPGQAEFYPGKRASAKIELLLERLSESIAQGHRALVFSQWTSFLDLVEPFLAEAGLTWMRLDGSTKDRAGVVAGFQDPNGPPVMLLSLKAGGVGLTLTAADHVYLLDPWWNPAVEEQAADRAHRIGQENPVLIHRLVADGTVEDRILKLQEKKREIARAALGEGKDAGAGLTREDLLALLEDLG